jgi:hypothetical protein
MRPKGGIYVNMTIIEGKIKFDLNLLGNFKGFFAVFVQRNVVLPK